MSRPRTLQDAYRDFMENIDRSPPIVNVRPKVMKCVCGCDKEIDTDNEAYLFYGGAYRLNEDCLSRCNALKGITIRVKEELIEDDNEN